MSHSRHIRLKPSLYNMNYSRAPVNNKNAHDMQCEWKILKNLAQGEICQTEYLYVTSYNVVLSSHIRATTNTYILHHIPFSGLTLV